MKWILAFAFALPAAPALAQEPGGTFTGTLDGNPMTCQIWPMQSDFSSFGNTLSISIMTNRCEGVEGLGQIALSFEKTGESIDSVEIRLRGEGDSADLYGGSETGATLQLDSASADDGFLSLSGNISARVGSSDNRGKTIDLSAARALEISFSGVIEGIDP